MHVLWDNFVEVALKQEQLMCMPPPCIIGNGSKNIEKKFEANKKGLGGKKIVIELKKE